MRDLQAPYITEAEIFGVDNEERYTTPIVAHCENCGKDLHEGEYVTQLKTDGLVFCDEICFKEYLLTDMGYTQGDL